MNQWQCGRFALDLSTPQVMGIVNLTPDSFSDGGRHRAVGDAVATAERQIEEGAALIDLGAESSRPGATPVGLEEELARLVPVLAALRDAPVPVSVDTYKPETMQVALDLGAAVINDIYALRQPGALDAVADARCGLVLMHMQGAPATMQDDPHYQDACGEVAAFLRERVAAASRAGIAAARIVVDPGFGFGKRGEDNQALLDGLEGFTALPAAGVLVGLSRKGWIGKMVGRPAAERLGASIAAALIAAQRGARIIRCHDVAATVDALKVWRALHAGQEGQH